MCACVCVAANILFFATATWQKSLVNSKLRLTTISLMLISISIGQEKLVGLADINIISYKEVSCIRACFQIIVFRLGGKGCSSPPTSEITGHLIILLLFFFLIQKDT